MRTQGPGNEVTCRILGHTLKFMVSSQSEKYWYNSRSKEVEFGMLSPSVDRVGPFDTFEEAQAAPQVLRDRAEAWAREESDED